MYNPFDKRIEELTIDNVKALREKQVTEGLYIEYKSVFTDPLKIAHSIASFANTYGGWYFIGIDSGTTNLPTGFSGFSLADQPKPIEHLRDVIKDKIDPFPIYYSKLIQVESGKAILVVEIPESDETPHVTKDGRIYRRNAAGSDPIPETNRYILDRLYEKSAKIQEEIERFCCNEIVQSKAETDNSWLEIYLMPYPLNRMYIESFNEEQFVDSLKQRMNEPAIVKFTENSQMSASIPLEYAKASCGSIVFRQVNKGQLPFMSLTFELFLNGNAKITIPFNYISHDSMKDSPAWNKLESALGFPEILLIKYIDGTNALSVFITLIQKYLDFLKDQNWKEKFLVAYRVENTWRRTLFFNSDAWAKHIDKYGVPFCQRNAAWIPSILRKDNMVEEMPKDGVFQLIQFMIIATHFGLFPHESGNFIKDWLKSFEKKKK